MKVLTAVPVYNEEAHVDTVLDAIVAYSDNVLVVDDGSTDATPRLLEKRSDVTTIRHEPNRGYGAALKTAFEFAAREGYDIVVTVDCDGQHQPQRIPMFVETMLGGSSKMESEHRASFRWDVVSGSRYLEDFQEDSSAPQDRRAINRTITSELRRQFGLQLTDAFCGFKAYRVAALQSIDVYEDGYAMPLDFWVQAAAADFRICELPVPRIYLDEERSFGGDLDKAATRLRYYRSVIASSRKRTHRETALSSARPSTVAAAAAFDCEGWLWASKDSA